MRNCIEVSLHSLQLSLAGDLKRQSKTKLKIARYCTLNILKNNAEFLVNDDRSQLKR